MQFRNKLVSSELGEVQFDPLSQMKDTAIRKAFGSRIKELRKSHGWTQKQLAAQLGIRFQLLNNYEGGQHSPPAENLIKLADVLKTTIDYLLTGNPEQEYPNVNNTLFRKFQAMERFGNSDKETIITLIDAMIAKHNVEHAIKPVN
jgi:transcriptional regulator with XRE-family HTH domain